MLGRKPIINYIFEDSKHIYYPDGYIEKENKIIEIKSDYTFMKEYDKNMAKIEACKSAGYEIELIVYSPKGDVIEVIVIVIEN